MSCNSAILRLLALIVSLGMLGTAHAQTTAASSELVALGSRIYNQGRLDNGEALKGLRDGVGFVSGPMAACANCHRPSGMGQVEGDQQVPPISGNFLFNKPGQRRVTTMDPHVSKLFNQAHVAYTDESLRRAIREGMNSRNLPMSRFMPRYQLSDREVDALVAYLSQLSDQWSPGVSEAQIDLATVITPEVGAGRRKAFLDMVQTIVRQKNASTVVAGDKTRNRHHMTTAAELVLGTERRWNLQVWELQGPSSTWKAQLEQHYRDHPVFALVSGLSESTWQPVQDFCEAQGVPSWFPSVPVSGETAGRYALYFSRGVRLEAGLVAHGLGAPGSKSMRVVQVYRDGDTGQAAATALRSELATAKIDLRDERLAPEADVAAVLRKVLAQASPGDAMMLWLSPGDLGALAAVAPKPGVQVFLSGQLAGGDWAPLPGPWRSAVTLAYPYEIPGKRQKNLDYFNAWLSLSHVALVDTPMQSEVFFAMNFLTDTISEMLDNLYRDYLVERAEQMLDRREGLKAEQESRDRVMLGREGDLLRRRGPMTMEAQTRIAPLARDDNQLKSFGTTLYTHLGLGPGQRFASKTGYLVRFSGTEGRDIVALTEPMAP